MNPKSSTERSLARNLRAARVLPPVTLDERHATRLARLLAIRGETYSAWVRRKIERERLPGV